MHLAFLKLCLQNNIWRLKPCLGCNIFTKSVLLSQKSILCLFLAWQIRWDWKYCLTRFKVLEKIAHWCKAVFFSFKGMMWQMWVIKMSFYLMNTLVLGNFRFSLSLSRSLSLPATLLQFSLNVHEIGRTFNPKQNHCLRIQNTERELSKIILISHIYIPATTMSIYINTNLITSFDLKTVLFYHPNLIYVNVVLACLDNDLIF